MVQHCLKPLTSGRGISESNPLADLRHFDTDIREVGRRAEEDGNSKWLSYAINALIVKPKGRIQSLAGQQYPFSDKEMVELLCYTYAKLWPEQTLANEDTMLEVEFESMSNEIWQHIRSSENLFDED